MSGRSDKPGHEELLSRARAVKLLIFDVDGVLTDGGQGTDAFRREIVIIEPEDFQPRQVWGTGKGSQSIVPAVAL